MSGISLAKADRSKHMDILNAADCAKTKIQDYPYKGKKYPVKEVWIQWLSQAGPKDSPDYGLRLFTIGPEGEIAIHNHLYYQTMYILTGHLLMVGYDGATERQGYGKGNPARATMFSSSHHGTSQPSQCEQHLSPVALLCCIANVYEE